LLKDIEVPSQVNEPDVIGSQPEPLVVDGVLRKAVDPRKKVNEADLPFKNFLKEVKISSQVSEPDVSHSRSENFSSQLDAKQNSRTLIDNAADLSIVNTLSKLEHPHTAPTTWLTGVNGVAQPYSTRGTWRQKVDNEGTIDELTQHNTLLVPKSPQNILALKGIENDHNATIRRHKTMKVFENVGNRTIMTTKQGQDGMYYLNTPEAVNMTAVNAADLSIVNTLSKPEHHTPRLQHG
jgi:hypothetical protein